MNPATSSTQPSPYIVLVAMAFDETDTHALREAARICALRPHSQLHVVHAVVEEAATTATQGLVSVADRLQAAPEEMQRRVESLQAAVPQRVVGHVRVGSPERAILQTAADLDADLIVVGTHQRRGLKKLVLGSVATQVLQGARCPVLAAIEKDHDEAARSERPDPPCPECVQARASTQGAQLWCERHARGYMKPHVYEPSDTPRTSVMPTY